MSIVILRVVTDKSGGVTRFVHVHRLLHMHTLSGMVAECGRAARPRRNPAVALYDPLLLLTMTAHPTHRITPTMIGDGPWAGGPCCREDTPVTSGDARVLPDQESVRSRGIGQSTAIAWGSQQHMIARLVLRPQPCSAMAARDFTRAALRDWGTGELFADAALVISELVTNAIRHGLGAQPESRVADGRIELVLLLVAGALVCLVTDPSPEAPALLESDYTAERGRGLRIVDGLSSRWGWTPLGDGCKAVWAALPVA
jgi:anti-sigma regulatory factor (Ser/Thr protein kinase)